MALTMRSMMVGCGLLAALPTVAQAQASFSVTMFGDAFFEAAAVTQQNDAGLRSTEFRNRFRINFVPKAKADNGLEYGARLRIRANDGTRNTDSDRAFLFANGSFGLVQLGVVNGAANEKSVGRPIDYHHIFGFYDVPRFWFGSGTTNLTNPVGTLTDAADLYANNFASKIVYYAPRLAGVQLHGSYTPRSDSYHADINRAKTNPTTTNWTGNFQDIVEIGANYLETFDGVTVAAVASYIGGTAQGNAAGVRFENLRGYTAGANVAFAGFKFGGGYANNGRSGQQRSAGLSRDDFRTWNVGAQYTTGAWILGAGYTNGQDPGSLTVPGNRKNDWYSVGVRYAVAPGLTLDAEYSYFRYDDDRPATATARFDDKGSVYLLRSQLAF